MSPRKATKGKRGRLDARIFSGEGSGKMWESINSAKTIAQLRYALYFVCCRLQVLEGSLRAAGVETRKERK